MAIPKAVNNVNPELLNPRNLWANPSDWDTSARSLAEKFIKNFESFTDNELGKRLVNAGPKL
jgi:phosphoenolpyruvate carboxykinase (ATP)